MTESTGLTMELGRHAAELTFADLPRDVVDLATLCVLDWFGVTVAGSHEPGPRKLMAVLAGDLNSGSNTIVGQSVRTGALEAALINGTSSHVLDFDDVNVTLIGHPSVAIIGAALPQAEKLGSTGAEFLCAFVAGYETACRIAAAVGPTSYIRGFHNTGTIGTFGAAAACAHLLNLDAEGVTAALGLAASQAAGLGCMVGTMTKSLQAGKACQNGMLAALLAQQDFTTDMAAIEIPKGFAATASGTCDSAAGLIAPATDWYVLANLFKYDASCYMTHSALAGTRDLISQYGLAATQIAELHVHVGEVEFATAADPDPASGLAVKFSVAHLVAMAVLGRSTMVIDDADALDRDVVAFRQKVTVRPDGISGAPTRVEAVLTDGQTVVAERDVNTPELDRALQRRRVEDKFRAVAREHLGVEHTEAVVQAVAELATAADLNKVLALCVPSETRTR